MEKSTPARGRPADPATRAAILRAAFALLLERGYEGMAIEAVAAAAGAGKTTIYRWWESKAALAVDAFYHETVDALAMPNTSSARDDFRAQILELSQLLRGPRGRVLAAMLGGARTDPALAAALGARWLEPRRQWGIARMTRAVKEGQCRPGTDVHAALGVLYGPLYAPLLFGQNFPTAAQVEAHLDVAFAGVFA